MRINEKKLQELIEKYKELHEAEQTIEAGEILKDLQSLQSSSSEEGEKIKVDENTSDGYHTFKELYEHRIVLFMNLMKCYPKISWRANNNDDGTHWDGRFVAGIHLDSGDISYHLPEDKWTMLDGMGIKTTLNAPKRDGYTASDVVKRLEKHLTSKATSEGEEKRVDFRSFGKQWQFIHSIPMGKIYGLAMPNYVLRVEKLPYDKQMPTAIFIDERID